MRKLYLSLIGLIVLSLVLSACAGAATQPAATQPGAGQPATEQPVVTEAPAATESAVTEPAVTESAATEPAATEPVATGGDDKLSEILARGTVIISTDPAYPPQSELAPGGQRAADTKCSSDQQTASELTGFDIDTAVEIANRLGVEACFVTPAWDAIVGGNWADRWDLSIGSVTITPERMEKLYFTQPYYTTPAAVFVHQDNTTFTQPSDLSGKRVGACTACTYERYLDGTLEIPGETIDFVIKDPQFTGYDTDTTALQDLALGDGVRLDGVMTAEPTGQGVIADGMPLKQLGEPLFFEYLAGAVDKASSKDPVPFVQKLSEIIQEMNSDGTLAELSQKYYETDLATAAAEFDLAALDQWP
jgi:polar amino acid transport system substrate-binding protein